jgi:hypothetical protein
MTNQRDTQFNPSPSLEAGTGGVEFQPAPGAQTSTGAGEQHRGAGAPVEQALDQAGRLMHDAQERALETVHDRFDDQRHRAADSLSSVAQTLRRSTRELDGDQQHLSRYINQAADRVEDLAGYLHDRELEDIVHQIEHFARRQPVAFLGGAFALGVLGARFLKSSRTNAVRYREYHEMGTRALTSRMEDPERDAVGRPRAPGYAPPSERAASEHKAAGPRT